MLTKIMIFFEILGLFILYSTLHFENIFIFSLIAGLLISKSPMVPKAYIKQQLGFNQCFVKKQIISSFSVTPSFAIGKKQNTLIWQGSIWKLGKSIWNNAGKIITLGLATQIPITQAFRANTTEKDFTSEDNLAYTFPLLPFLQINQTSLMINNTILVSEKLPTNTTIESAVKMVTSSASNVLARVLIQPYYIDVTEELKQFDKVDLALQKAIQIFNTDNIGLKQTANRVKKVRNLDVLGKKSNCTVSQDKLIGLNNAIKKALSNTSTKLSPNNCELNSNNLDNCNELLKQIQCGVKHLRDGYEKASKHGNSLNEVDKFINAYNDLTAEFTKDIDGMKNYETQPHKEMIDKLETELHNLQEKFYRKLEKLATKTEQLCISEIHSGKIDEAIMHFKDLENDSKLSKIIEMAYNNYEKLENIENILKFIRFLPNVSHAVVAYQTMYSQLERNNNLNSPKVLMFQHSINETINLKGNNFLFVDQRNKLTALKDKLITRVIGVFAEWGKNGNYNQLRLYINKYRIDANHNINNYLPNIIQNIYANNLSNFRTVLKFIYELPLIVQQCSGYYELFSAMKGNNHLDSTELIFLAYKVIQSIRYYSHLSLEQELKILYDLKSRFSSGILQLICNRDELVTINSKRHEGRTLYGSKHGNIYTYPTCYYGRDDCGNQIWIVEISVDYYYDNIYFRFRNKENDLILYANDQGDAKSDWTFFYLSFLLNDRRFQERMALTFEWQAFPRENGSYFYFKNRYNERILDAGDKCGKATCVHAYGYFTGTSYQLWSIT